MAGELNRATTEYGDFSYIDLQNVTTDFQGIPEGEYNKILWVLDFFRKNNRHKKIQSFFLNKCTRLSNGRHIDYVRGIYIHHEPVSE